MLRSEASPMILLRDVTEADLPIFFEQQLAPEANHMAAFTAKEPADRDAFMAHWTKILGDETITKKTILCEGQVVGHVLSFIQLGKPEVSYWIGKQYWGKGIATKALSEFLSHVKARPLYARAAKDNIASIRALEKCGFTISGEDKGFSNARGEEVEEFILQLSMTFPGALIIPERLAATCRKTPERAAWLKRLPDTLRDLERRWSLTLGPPFDGEEVSCAWVAPVVRADGTSAVLKLGMPHMEGEHELHGLRFWNGDPTVRLLEADEHLNAMLLERCEPGTVLRALPEPEQDVVIAGLLRRLWRLPSAPHPFRPLSAMTAYWSEETLAEAERWPDAGLVREGLQLFEELPQSAPREVLLATDLHAGNVLRAQREPWLVIDPKPFVGDPAYDATQHLFNCAATRLRADPNGTIRRFAELLGVDHERVRLWMFARAAAESRDDWSSESMALARVLAP